MEKLAIIMKKICRNNVICRWWNGLSNHQKRHFNLNIFWGVLIAVLLHISSYTGYGQGLLNKVYDALVELEFEREIHNPRYPNISDKIVFVELREKDYESTQGLWTPRIKLANTIKAAVEKGAKVVVVDFAMEKIIPLYLKNGEVVDENEQFMKTMRETVKMAKRNKPGTVLIFPQRYEWVDKAWALKPFFEGFKNLKDKSGETIVIGDPYLEADANDATVRKWEYYKVIKENSGYDIHFSLQILAATYLCQENAYKTLSGLKSEILIPNKKNRNPWPIINCRETKIEIKQNNLANRYRFFIPRKEDYESKKLRDPVDQRLFNRLDSNYNSLSNDKIAVHNLENKIVIIGSTYKEAADLHRTPVGDLPGMYLIGNGINVLLMGKQLKTIPISQEILIEAIIILAASLGFLYMHPSVSFAALSVLFFLIFTPLSFCALKYNYMLNFWLPVIGIGLRGNIAELGELWKEFRRKMNKIRDV